MTPCTAPLLTQAFPTHLLLQHYFSRVLPSHESGSEGTPQSVGNPGALSGPAREQSRREWVFVCAWLTHFAAQQKLTQWCKSTPLQLKSLKTKPSLCRAGPQARRVCDHHAGGDEQKCTVCTLLSHASRSRGRRVHKFPLSPCLSRKKKEKLLLLVCFNKKTEF